MLQETKFDPVRALNENNINKIQILRPEFGPISFFSPSCDRKVPQNPTVKTIIAYYFLILCSPIKNANKGLYFFLQSISVTASQATSRRQTLKNTASTGSWYGAGRAHVTSSHSDGPRVRRGGKDE